MDSETVGILLNKHRAKVSSCLFNLVRKGTFTYQFLQTSCGRPIKLYAPEGIKDFDVLLRRKQYFSTCLLLRLIKKIIQ